MSVVTRQEMADQGANTISQALEYTPGSTPASAAVATRFDAAISRGYHTAATSITLFLDGMRLMSDGGSHNVLQIDPWFIERAWM